ncbi:hypothetical protein F0562_006626 [Nyssa sinensis]|uniref:Uncharacterized protein n=1 Tax=Nyssa sinensis TaxID=561372 RepID=A0A5J5AQM5_9ASTE|nr:hypothetical protein F0562_006626 [Nyssa sinensis]
MIYEIEWNKIRKKSSLAVVSCWGKVRWAWLLGPLWALMQGTESRNAQGQMERRVETVDYQSSVGQLQEQRPVQVVHHLHSPEADSRTSGGILAGAAAAVATTLEAAKEAISGDNTNTTNSKNR